MSNEEKINKLPRWAKEHIRHIEGERDEAKATLKKFLDDQTKSPFYTTEFGGFDQEFKTRYVQGHTVNLNHAGVHLIVTARNLWSPTRDSDVISVRWASIHRFERSVICQPTGFQQIELFLPATKIGNKQ